MNTFLQNLRLEDLKSNAKNLKKALEALGTTLTHSTALNLSSQGFGFKDYNTAKAILMDKKPAVVDLFEYEDAISVLNYKLENHAYYFQDKENIKEFISALRNKLNDEDLALFLQHEFFPKMKTVLGYEVTNWLSLYDDKPLGLNSFNFDPKTKELFPGSIVCLIPNKKITKESEEEASEALGKILKALVIDKDFTKALALDGDYFSLYDVEQFESLVDIRNDLILLFNYKEKTFNYTYGSVNYSKYEWKFVNHFIDDFCRKYSSLGLKAQILSMDLPFFVGDETKNALGGFKTTNDYDLIHSAVLNKVIKNQTASKVDFSGTKESMVKTTDSKESLPPFKIKGKTIDFLFIPLVDQILNMSRMSQEIVLQIGKYEEYIEKVAVVGVKDGKVKIEKTEKTKNLIDEFDIARMFDPYQMTIYVDYRSAENALKRWLRVRSKRIGTINPSILDSTKL